MELETVDCVLDDIVTRRIAGRSSGLVASEKRLENITPTRILKYNLTENRFACQKPERRMRLEISHLPFSPEVRSPYDAFALRKRYKKNKTRSSLSSSSVTITPNGIIASLHCAALRLCARSSSKCDAKHEKNSPHKKSCSKQTTTRTTDVRIHRKHARCMLCSCMEQWLSLELRTANAWSHAIHSPCSARAHTSSSSSSSSMEIVYLTMAFGSGATNSKLNYVSFRTNCDVMLITWLPDFSLFLSPLSLSPARARPIRIISIWPKPVGCSRIIDKRDT